MRAKFCLKLLKSFQQYPFAEMVYEREREDFEIQKVEKKERIDKNDLQLD